MTPKTIARATKLSIPFSAGDKDLDAKAIGLSLNHCSMSHFSAAFCIQKIICSTEEVWSCIIKKLNIFNDLTEMSIHSTLTACMFSIDIHRFTA